MAELVRNGRADEVRVLSDASSALARGELLQRADAWDATIGVERYLHRCELKTARLFEAACRLGALEGGAGEAAAERLGRFGRRIGLAFQLLDDVLDVSGPAERTGKHRGTDLLDGTVTLPLPARARARPRAGGARPARRAHRRRRPRRCATASRPPARWRRRGRGPWPSWPRPSAALPDDLPEGQRRALDLVADGVVARYA